MPAPARFQRPVVNKPYQHPFGVVPDPQVVQYNGNEYRLLETGGIEAKYAFIASVGVHDLADVVHHTVTTVARSYSHVLHFMNGGLLQYAFNDSGQLIELTARNLACEVSLDHRLLFYQMPAE